MNLRTYLIFARQLAYRAGPSRSVSTLSIWAAAPFVRIFQEAGGSFRSWNGEEGYAPGEALACNRVLKPKALELIRESAQKS